MDKQDELLETNRSDADDDENYYSKDEDHENDPEHPKP